MENMKNKMLFIFLIILLLSWCSWINQTNNNIDKKKNVEKIENESLDLIINLDEKNIFKKIQKKSII